MTIISSTADFINVAHALLKDRTDHPNWEYTRALKRKLKKAGFAHIRQLSKVASVACPIKKVSGKDMSFYERDTRREFNHIALVWGSDVRDRSSILINFSSGFNDHNGPQVQGITTFHHYTDGDASAAELVRLIGKPDAATSLRPSLALERPEPPPWSPEMNFFFDTKRAPLIRKLRL